MSTGGLAAHRDPGRPPTHGARKALAEFGRGERLNYSRTHVKWRAVLAINLAVRLAGRQQWDAVEVALLDKSQPKRSRLKTALSVALTPLNAEQRERVLAGATVGTAYKLIEAYMFRQRSFIDGDGELIPCMRKSFLAYSCDWRRVLREFDAVPEEVEKLPTLQEYIKLKDAEHAQQAAAALQSGDHEPAMATASTEAGSPAGEARGAP